jgi:hypothetical protein
MQRIIRVLALAVTIGGGGLLARPVPARATMAPSPFGDMYCCESPDASTRCCYWTGCAISGNRCIKIG